MNQNYDVIVIGGGVIGSSIAFQLAKRHYSVLILEKDQLASKASSAAAGMLGAQAELEENNPLYSLASRSRDMFPNLATELKNLSGIDIELIQSGILKVAQTHEEGEQLKKTAAFHQSQGEQAEWLSQEKVHVQEPALADDIFGGMYVKKDGQVSAPQLAKAFARSAKILGVDILEYRKVQDFIKENDRIVGVQTQTNSYFTEHVVVAGGAWSQELTKKVNIFLPGHPVKGECFSVKISGQLVTSSIYSTSGYIVPKAGGRLIIGATQKPEIFDESVSLVSLSELIANAQKVIPAIKDATWEQAWSGIRPKTADGLPYISEHSHVPGLLIATGHYRNGILLAPITGVLIADIIDGKVNDNPFGIERIWKEVVE
ncbi:glycine oxidase ThiO [Virgibacillus phasianinus]|uniref:glycine oxidase n=1 Tax=Virgibacillus phasianinus TaxID=2017483 RepID=A0A220U7Q2_9BACI|nr:glycine oxidase ThiO [Virgibacillus phasianinus]ASK63916.1 glycine oxidase ThiO [Virgibacillus phasianinus]